MTNSEFMKILNDDSLELTVEELENIIEEELQKDESEMDPDLIEYCLYYINKAESNNGKDEKIEPDTKKPKKHRLRRQGEKNIDNSRERRRCCLSPWESRASQRTRKPKAMHFLFMKTT